MKRTLFPILCCFLLNSIIGLAQCDLSAFTGSPFTLYWQESAQVNQTAFADLAYPEEIENFNLQVQGQASMLGLANDCANGYCSDANGSQVSGAGTINDDYQGAFFAGGPLSQIGTLNGSGSLISGGIPLNPDVQLTIDPSTCLGGLQTSYALSATGTGFDSGTTQVFGGPWVTGANAISLFGVGFLCDSGYFTEWPVTITNGVLSGTMSCSFTPLPDPSSGSGTYTITFSTSPLQASPIVITTTSLPAGRVGMAYDSPPSTATGGIPFTTRFSDGTTPPYRWSITSPPPGLDISYYTGEVYGLPSVSGTYFPRLTAKDSTGATSQPKAFTVVIQPPQTKTRFTPQQKEYYTLLQADFARRGTTLKQLSKACILAGPEIAPLCTALKYTADADTLASAFLQILLSLDPADSNYKVITQPIPPVLILPAPNPAWSSAQLAAYNSLKNVLLTEEQLIGLVGASITTINRAQGAYEAGDTYWEQQQVAALNRYSYLEVFYWQLLLAQSTQASTAYSTSGFPPLTVTAVDATNFSMDIAKNGIDQDTQQQLTSLGVTSDGLALIAKEWSSFDPATISGDVPHMLDLSADVTTVQQLAGTFFTPFSSFTPKAQTSLSGFELLATFVLGANTDGFHCGTDDVSVRVGTFASTIPGPSFKLSSKGYCQFQGTNLQAVIKPTMAGYNLQFDWTGSRVVAPSGTPVMVLVGNDQGSGTL